MAVKNFKLESNQILWDTYFNTKIEEGTPKTSLNQYKPVLLSLKSKLDKQFNDIQVDEINSFMEEREGKNQNHLNGFLTFCISNKLIDALKDLILYLIPKDYATIHINTESALFNQDCIIFDAMQSIAQENININNCNSELQIGYMKLLSNKIKSK